jgi:hypothetical protein
LGTVTHEDGPVEARVLRRATLLQCLVYRWHHDRPSARQQPRRALIAGVLLALIGAFLTAPGKYYHRRIVAVALLVALLYTLRRTVRALSSPGDEHSQERTLPLHPSRPWTPRSWSTVGLTAIGNNALRVILIHRIRCRALPSPFTPYLAGDDTAVPRIRSPRPT